MRIYVNKQRKLIIAPDYMDRYCGVSNITVQIRDGKLSKVINKEIEDAINFIIAKYEPLFDTPIVDGLFKEKERAIKQLADYDTLLTDMVEEIEYEDTVD
ncbi:hypothetical protein BKX95_08460 [Streptococcus iniae]|nr:hypothetical protein BKX95_08460 [Streptococcus iniae]